MVRRTRYSRVPPLLVVAAMLFVCAASAPPRLGAAAESPPLFDVFTAGTDGYHTFRIPALIATSQGALLLFCEGRKTSRSDHGDVDLVLKRSADGGRTWGPLQLVYEEGGDDKITIGNPCPIVDRETGIVWLPFTRDNNDVFVTSSDDDGLTWAEPRMITSDVKAADWDWYATGPGNGIQLSRGDYQGRLVAPCDHRVKGQQDWGQSGRSHIIYSDDHGKTWKVGGATDWAMNECAVAELSDGKLMLNMRSYRGKSRRCAATSNDGGLTWSEAADVAELVEPVCQASFIRYSTADRGDRNRLLFCNPASANKREKLTIRLSYDEGRSWPVSKVLYPGSAAYSSLAVAPNRDIGLAFERDGYSKISFARFSLPWLAEGEESLPGKEEK